MAAQPVGKQLEDIDTRKSGASAPLLLLAERAQKALNAGVFAI